MTIRGCVWVLDLAGEVPELVGESAGVLEKSVGAAVEASSVAGGASRISPEEEVMRAAKATRRKRAFIVLVGVRLLEWCVERWRRLENQIGVWELLRYNGPKKCPIFPKKSQFLKLSKYLKIGRFDRVKYGNGLGSDRHICCLRIPSPN